MFDILTLVLGLLISPAEAQSVTCATRPAGDNTNACASTAFVHGGFQPTLTLPLSVANGGTGSSTPGLTAGANIIITGTWPFNTIASSGGAGTGVVGSGTQGQVAGYSSNGTSVIGTPANCIAIEAYGGGTGVSDNGAVLNTALGALPSAGGCIKFSAGTYAFTTPVTFTFPNAKSSVMLAGSGIEGTVLSWGSPAGSAYVFNITNQLNSVHMRDMTLTTSGVSASVGVLVTSTLVNSIISASTDFTNISFRGANGPFNSQYWQIGVKNVNVSNIKMDNAWFYGGSTLAGIGFYNIGVVSPQSYVDAVTMIGGGCEGINICLWMDTRVFYAQMISGVCSECNYGIYVPTASPGNTSLQVIGNEYSTNIAGVASAGTGVIGAANIAGNTFGINAGTGVSADFLQTSITGNWFSSNTGSPSGIVGVNFLSGSSTNIVTGNVLTGMAEGVANNTGSNGLNVQSNVYQSNTQNVAQGPGASMQVGGSCAGTSGTCTAGASN